MLIRGLRGVGDLDRERGLAEVNRANGLDTLYFLAASEHSHLSSQLVREVIAAELSLGSISVLAGCGGAWCKVVLFKNAIA